MARLLTQYREKIVPLMVEKFKYKNVMQTPKINKIVINIGLGEAKDNPKVVDIAIQELSMIAGQKPLITKAKKSISNFKVREGMTVGCVVTLRGKKMYEFLDRFINISVPRVRDFQGLNPNSFDKNGNYNLGIKEQYIFSEVDLDKSDKARGMNITLVFSSKNVEENRELLRYMGMPFKKKK